MLINDDARVSCLRNNYAIVGGKQLSEFPNFIWKIVVLKTRIEAGKSWSLTPLSLIS